MVLSKIYLLKPFMLKEGALLTKGYRIEYPLQWFCGKNFSRRFCDFFPLVPMQEQVQNCVEYENVMKSTQKKKKKKSSFSSISFMLCLSLILLLSNNLRTLFCATCVALMSPEQLSSSLYYIEERQLLLNSSASL